MKQNIMPLVIKVKDGRAYLHTNGWLDKKRNIKWVSITPLGSSPTFIQGVKTTFKCNVEFN